MRHSRRAVMTERYSIYMRKHIFNGKYFVRNLQIAICAVAAIALVVGLTVAAVSAKNEDKNDSAVVASAEVSVKEALFGTTETAKVTEDKVETAKVTTEKAATEKVFEELTTVAMAAVKEEEEPKEEPKKKSEFDGKCIANVEETLNIRKEPSAEAEFVGQMNLGAIATIQGSEGDWTKIKSGDVEGYVLTEYVLTGESAEELAASHVTLLGTVLEDGVNVRTEKSTEAEILTILNKDDMISVLEKPETEEIEEEIAVEDVESTEAVSTEEVIVAVTEAEATTEATTDLIAEIVEKVTEANTEAETTVEKKTDEEINWIPVMLEDGKVGYVSAEFISVNELYEIAVSAEELERKAAEEAAAEAARIAAEEEAKRQAAVAAAVAQNSSDNYQGAVTKPITTAEHGEYIGTFTITAYCGCKKCCGGHGKTTASGTTPTEGRTIAADTSILPYGTQVVIDGIVYTVEDCGSGVNGNHIDIFFATHKKALAFGKKTIKVYKY